MELRPGTRIGPLEIVDFLGAGGMGEVYRARDSRLRRDVAVKVLRDAIAADPSRRERMEREARVLASLNHPGIGAIYGLEESAAGPVLVLEIVDGDTLAERIRRGRVPLADTVALARQLADAVSYAHDRGIVHRDLKPANIKCPAAGRIKVLDFGLARAFADGFTDPATAATTLRTQSGTVLGTPAYMSPEQASGSQSDKRADIWSFGCVLFEMLTGHAAFARDTVTATVTAVLSEHPDWSRLPADTPPALRRVLLRCLRRDRDRRYHDMADVRLDLEEADGEERAVPVAAAARESTRALGAAALLAALGAVTINGLVLQNFIGPLANLYEETALALDPSVRIYIASSRSMLGLFVAGAVAALLAIVAGKRLPLIHRRSVLVAIIAVCCSGTVISLYLVARQGVTQAIRLDLGGKALVVERDLAALQLAAGRPAAAIAVIDPGKSGPRFMRLQGWGSPGITFQLAEAYRLNGDRDTARTLYQRAADSASVFDENLSEQSMVRLRSWQTRYGSEIAGWAPRVGDVRRLPDLVRAVSTQRLNELGPAK